MAASESKKAQAARKLKSSRGTAVVMAGVAATALAAGGTEIANAAAGPPAGTSGVIYACYSNTTRTLVDTTQAKGCKPGQTKLSWNAKGPQGPRGPRGLRGARGPQASGSPTATYYAYEKKPIPLKGGSRVVARITPKSTGDYIVNAQATLSGRGNAMCHVAVEGANSTSNLHSQTPLAKNSQAGTQRTYTLPMTGVVETFKLASGSQSTILELCRQTGSTKGSPVTLVDGAMTVTKVSSATKQQPTAPAPRHRFVKPAQPAGRVSPSRVGG
jgi:hypothetical protein